MKPFRKRQPHASLSLCLFCQPSPQYNNANISSWRLHEFHHDPWDYSESTQGRRCIYATMIKLGFCCCFKQPHSNCPPSETPIRSFCSSSRPIAESWGKSRAIIRTRFGTNRKLWERRRLPRGLVYIVNKTWRMPSPLVNALWPLAWAVAGHTKRFQ